MINLGSEKEEALEILLQISAAYCRAQKISEGGHSMLYCVDYSKVFVYVNSGGYRFLGKKWVCLLPPYPFNLYTKQIVQVARLDSRDAGKSLGPRPKSESESESLLPSSIFDIKSLVSSPRSQTPMPSPY